MSVYQACFRVEFIEGKGCFSSPDRIKIGTSMEDAGGLVACMKPVASRLREMSPLYKRKNDGSVQ
jgi:hypothetical protein